MAHLLRPRLRPEGSYPQLEFLARQSRVADGVRQIQRIRRRAAQHRRPEVVHQRDLLFRVARRHGDYRCPDVLRARMRSQSARKQSVAIRHLEDVRLVRPVGREGPRQAFLPHRQVLARIAHHRRFSRGAGRRVDAHNLAHGYSTQPEGIVIPQVQFRSERQLHDVVYAVDVIRGHVHFLHLPAVEGRVVVHPLHRFLQPDALQLAQALPVHAFDALIPNLVFHTCCFSCGYLFGFSTRKLNDLFPNPQIFFPYIYILFVARKQDAAHFIDKNKRTYFVLLSPFPIFAYVFYRPNSP